MMFSVGFLRFVRDAINLMFGFPLSQVQDAPSGGQGRRKRQWSQNGHSQHDRNCPLSRKAAQL